MRTFIAVNLSAEIKKELYRLVARLKKLGDNIKWVEQDNLHITLKFLGNVDKIEEVIKAAEVAASGIKKFKMTLQGAGNFGGRVLWVGVTAGQTELKEIADKLNWLKEEKRPFSGHVTIGRTRARAGKTLKELKKFKEKLFGEMTVEKISIMKSTLKKDGPVYEVIKEVVL